MILPAIVVILTFLSAGCRSPDSNPSSIEAQPVAVTKKLCQEKATNDSIHVLIPERRLKLESQILTKCLIDNGASPKNPENEIGRSDPEKARTITKRAADLVKDLLPLIPKHAFNGIGCILAAFPDKNLFKDRIGHGLVSCRQSRLNDWSAPSYFDLSIKDSEVGGDSFESFVSFYAFQTSSTVQKSRWLVGSSPMVVSPNLYETIVVDPNDCFHFGKDKSSCVIAFGGTPPAGLIVENIESEGNRLVYGQDFELIKIFDTTSFQAPLVARPWMETLPN